MGDKLDRRIEDKRDDLVALTQALVRIPTINPPGEAYRPCAELLGARLAARGFEVAYIRGEGAVGDSDAFPRTNVVARIEGGAPGPTVHFNGHIDVVEAGAGWTREPFGAVVEDGRIYGRGTCDMKGGLAAAVIAVEALIEEAEGFPGALEISGTVDEESGGYAGVAYLAGQGFFSKPKVDHVIIPEPLNVDRVCLGHRGVWWAEIETEGKMAHGSMPFLGDCAVRHMGAVLSRIEQELYPSLAAKRTNMPVVPEGARQSTLNINSFHGGLAEDFDGLPSPLVPDRCRMVIDRRFLIFRFSLRDVMEVLPTMTDARAPVVQAVSAQIARVLGRPAQHIISPGSYDQKHVARIGHLDDCIAYGPGILDLAHQPDEYVVIDDMVNAAKVMAGAARQLLTGPVP
jgi:succinyl-diaminopimelate desuccinylase